jgi:hypothetical protein
LNFIFQPLEELFASKLQKAIKITEAPDPARGDDEVDGSSIALSVSCIIRERENTSILKFGKKKIVKFAEPNFEMNTTFNGVLNN